MGMRALIGAGCLVLAAQAACAGVVATGTTGGGTTSPVIIYAGSSTGGGTVVAPTIPAPTIPTAAVSLPTAQAPGTIVNYIAETQGGAGVSPGVATNKRVTVSFVTQVQTPQQMQTASSGAVPATPGALNPSLTSYQQNYSAVSTNIAHAQAMNAQTQQQAVMGAVPSTLLQQNPTSTSTTSYQTAYGYVTANRTRAAALTQQSQAQASNGSQSAQTPSQGHMGGASPSAVNNQNLANQNLPNPNNVSNVNSLSYLPSFTLPAVSATSR